MLTSRYCQTVVFLLKGVRITYWPTPRSVLKSVPSVSWCSNSCYPTPLLEKLGMPQQHSFKKKACENIELMLLRPLGYHPARKNSAGLSHSFFAAVNHFVTLRNFYLHSFFPEQGGEVKPRANPEICLRRSPSSNPALRDPSETHRLRCEVSLRKISTYFTATHKGVPQTRWK